MAVISRHVSIQCVTKVPTRDDSSINVPSPGNVNSFNGLMITLQLLEMAATTTPKQPVHLAVEIASPLGAQGDWLIKKQAAQMQFETIPGAQEVLHSRDQAILPKLQTPPALAVGEQVELVIKVQAPLNKPHLGAQAERHNKRQATLKNPIPGVVEKAPQIGVNHNLTILGAVAATPLKLPLQVVATTATRTAEVALKCAPILAVRLPSPKVRDLPIAKILNAIAAKPPEALLCAEMDPTRDDLSLPVLRAKRVAVSSNGVI